MVFIKVTPPSITGGGGGEGEGEGLAGVVCILLCGGEQQMSTALVRQNHGALTPSIDQWVEAAEGEEGGQSNEGEWLGRE